jgi:hypothetical protein
LGGLISGLAMSREWDHLPKVAVLLIGSGPSSLALVLRVLHPGLADLWSDEEHRLGGRFADAHGEDEDDEHAIAPEEVSAADRPHTQPIQAAPLQRKHRQAQHAALPLHERSSIPGMTAAQVRESIVVVDPFGDWCEAWDRSFAALKIPQLRSSPYTYIQRTCMGFCCTAIVKGASHMVDLIAC